MMLLGNASQPERADQGADRHGPSTGLMRTRCSSGNQYPGEGQEEDGFAEVGAVRVLRTSARGMERNG